MLKVIYIFREEENANEEKTSIREIKNKMLP